MSDKLDGERAARLHADLKQMSSAAWLGNEASTAEVVRVNAEMEWLFAALPSLLADGRRLDEIRVEVDEFAAFFACAGPGADVGAYAIDRLRVIMPSILAGTPDSGGTDGAA